MRNHEKCKSNQKDTDDDKRMKHRFICVSSVLINWCWMWSVAFLMTCLRNRNGCSPQKSAFIMITTTVLWYLGFLMNLYFISFNFFFLSRHAEPTDRLTDFVWGQPRSQETRLEATLAWGEGGWGGGATPWCSWWGWAARPGSPYPEPISNRICSFSHPFSDRQPKYWILIIIRKLVRNGILRSALIH